MIARTPAPSPAPGRPPRAVPAWRRALAEAVTDPAELLDLLALPAALLPEARRAAELFGLRVPRGFVARMRPGDPRDPLLLQVLPLGRELEPAPGYSEDPVGEGAAAVRPGLLHKYRGRVLLVVTGACAVHCRYCFRRHFPYAESHPGWSGWGDTLEAMAADPEVREVILSGGDPLSVSDERLAALVAGIEGIPHVERLRVHTRNPVVLPERVDDGLLAWLGGTRLRTVVVVHANHAREIDEPVRAAFARLREAGATLLNQSVLLAGVNDSADALTELSEALFEGGALPYYLHLLDPVQGAAHFEVPEERARRLLGEAAARLPGYLVPRLVREVPGAPAKVPVAPLLP
ncbi:MAG TPA: EF-P beta-lysylation protein EpmB [Thermoanaerobaculia bacterium]